MRKFLKITLTVTFALAFSASMALGQQNTTDIRQVGDQGNSDAIVTQESGSGNEAYVDQNSGFTNNAVSRLGHVTEILQQGSGNFVDVVQSENQAGTFVDQVGDRNEVRVSQAGFSDADIEQTGNVNFVGGFDNPKSQSSTGQQNSSSFPGDKNDLDVVQKGNLNVVGIDQRDNTDADINIDGTNNLVRVDQFESQGALDKADIDVTGDDNIAYLTQSDGGNTFTLTQKSGDLNKARLSQSGGGTANILQDGGTNTVQGISGNLIGISAGGSTLDVDQIGTGNTLSIDQRQGADATVYQEGGSNTSTVTQTSF